MSNWKTYKLGDLVTFQRGHDLTKTQMQGGEFPVAGSNGVIGFHNEYTTKAPSITIGRSGNIGNAYFYDRNFWAHNTTLYIKEFKSCDPKFIYYLLKTISFGGHNSGSAVPSLNRNYIHPIEIQAPDLTTQTQIAQILSSLDDKIELLQQMNQTLENIAQAVFKEWFVDFNFPDFDGELVDGLPKGWKKEAIGSLFKETIGGDWGKEEYSEEFSELVHIVRGTDFDKILNGNISSVPIRYIKKSNFNKRKIEKGNLLLEISGGSKDQPTGRTILFTDELLSQFDYPVVPASFCRLIRPIDINSSMYLDTFLKYFYSIGGTWEYQNQSTGISNFQFTHFSQNKTVFIPDDKTMELFSNLIEANIRKICENIIQIQTLTQTRDTLLPKLMSGNLEIN